MEHYVSRALVVAEPWIDLILSGQKTWEMRGRATKIRGWVGLIRKGSGQVVGAVKIIGSGEALDSEAMLANHHRHLIPAETIRAGLVTSWNTPWHLQGAVKFVEPIRYAHPPGAVTWVSLEDHVCAAVFTQLTGIAPKPDQAITFAVPKRAKEVDLQPKPVEQITTKAVVSSVSKAGEARLLGEAEITNGNLKNNHIYLRRFLDAFPSDLIGGRDQTPPKQAFVAARGIAPTQTDICPRHRFFRDRNWTRRFFEMHDAQPGDRVAIYEVAERSYQFQLLKASYEK